MLQAALAAIACAQGELRFTDCIRLTNGEVRLKLSVPTGTTNRIDASTDLSNWVPQATLPSTAGLVDYTNSAAAFLQQAFYRGVQAVGAGLLTGDHVPTAEGDVIIHPINHATFVMEWGSRMIYVDPVGGSSRFTGLPRADLILVTHDHSDHYDNTTLTAVKQTNTVIVAPAAVVQKLTTALKPLAVTLTNGAGLDTLDCRVDAVPAYNLTVSNHPKGVGNGYVLTLGGKRIYISGDTEDTPELRALEAIDIAFVCMNLPYTMSVTKAASAVRQFRPRVVYPYHYSGGSDVNQFKRLVGMDLGIEVRLRKWY